MHHLGELQPGESKRIVTLLGQDSSVEAALPSIRKYRDLQAVDKALAELAEFWDEILPQTQVETPDAGMNSTVNIHNPRQCFITKNWSRYLSLYQLGFGARAASVFGTARRM